MHRYPETQIDTNSRSVLFAVLVLMVALVPALPAQAAGEAIVPGPLRVDATFEHLGVTWDVSGDTDLDSSMGLEYRPVGETVWRAAAPAVRAYPTIYVQNGPLGLDYWGASAMFLDSGTSYELRATLTDPDGGSESRTVTAATRRWPKPTERILHVAPGSGGGSGTPTDPYRGLQTAADVATAGDTFEVAPGTYEPFQVLSSGSAGSPISFVAEPGAVVDGAGTERGAITIGNFDRTTSHIIVSGFTIRDSHWGVDAQHTRDILVANNTITDVDDGIVNRRGDGVETNQTIHGNTIIGRTPWPGTGIPSERGIDLKGTGNVVANNRVHHFGDCISVQPSTGPSFGNDVYGNDAAYCVDDGIEIDYNQANVRVWRNRVFNARMGVSVQPIRGGPAYIFRNELFNLESVPVKMHNHTTGFIVAHNTSAKVGDGYGDNGAMWRNATLRNNVFLGTRYAFEFTTVRDEGFRDVDYNGWGTSREIDPGGPWFKWENVRYDHLSDLPQGVENHGIEMGFSDLVDATVPSDWDIDVPVGSRDLRLSNARGVDAGAHLANLNDPFVLDSAPDLGAFEKGVALPVYGPEGIGRFVDVPPSHLFFVEIEWLAEQSITQGCTPTRFCPANSVTRAQMASFLARALDLAPATTDYFTDDNNNIHEPNINALAQAGITLGCGSKSFCPLAEVRRDQMASFLTRALSLAPTATDYFTDDSANTHEANINALAASGITQGCTPTTYCPGTSVTRAQMAAFLFRGLAT